eukprot:gene10761-12732_t
MAGSMRRCPSSCIVEDQIHEEAVPEYSTDVFQDPEVIQALIGALGTTSTTFILPLLFAVVLLPEAGMMSRAEVWFCKALLLIAGLLMVLGVYSALSRVVERWSSYGSPFQCDAP